MRARICEALTAAPSSVQASRTIARSRLARVRTWWARGAYPGARNEPCRPVAYRLQAGGHLGTHPGHVKGDQEVRGLASRLGQLAVRLWQRRDLTVARYLGGMRGPGHAQVGRPPQVRCGYQTPVRVLADGEHRLAGVDSRGDELPGAGQAERIAGGGEREREAAQAGGAHPHQR